MRTYLDTSALVTLYYPEPASESVAAYVAGKRLPFSGLHELEAKNALMLKVFRGEADEARVRQTIAALDADLQSGVFVRPAADWHSVFRLTVGLATQHSATLGCRSLDVLHVALARSLGAEAFLTFDDRQRELASTADLSVVELT